MVWWLYRNSSMWRRAVAYQKRGGKQSAIFATAVLGSFLCLGGFVMDQTGRKEAELEAMLKKKKSTDASVLARTQKQRLQELLDETRHGKGEERYAAALKVQVTRK